MVTGASTCDLAIILVDARHGVQVQTKRHSYLTSLLGIENTVVAINKMDLVDHSKERFDEIRDHYLAFAERLDLKRPPFFIPISALKGDWVVEPGDNMTWFEGPTLMEHLETVQVIAQRRRRPALPGPDREPARPERSEASPARWPAGSSSPATRSWSCPRARSPRSTGWSPSTATSRRPVPAARSR